MSNIYLAIATDTTDGLGILQFAYTADTLEIYNFFCTKEKSLREVLLKEAGTLVRAATFLEAFIYNEIPGNVKFEAPYKECCGVLPVPLQQFTRSKRRVKAIDESLLIEDLSLFNDCLRVAYGAIGDGKVF